MEATYATFFFTFAFLVFLYQLSPLLHLRLRKIPGPIWAKCLNLWRFIDTWRDSHEMGLVKLHDKYGSAVHVGPNLVSIADPDAIDKIHGSRTDFVKVGGHWLASFTAAGGTDFSAKHPVNVLRATCTPFERSLGRKNKFRP